jgi:hypothetical protein
MRVLIVVVVFILIMILFPPFHVVYAPGIVIYEGYHFLYSPPSFQGRIVASVDIRSLFVQLFAVIALASMHLYIVRDKPKQ